MARDPQLSDQSWHLARAVLLLALFTTTAGAHDKAPGAMLCARSADGAHEAWIVPGAGLVVRAPNLSADGVDLFVEPWGGLPRFDTDGSLVFETAFDDGHALYGRRTWRWVPATGRARRIHADEAVPPLPSPDQPSDGGVIKLCIDPGHGGADPGAVGNGLLEKDVVLDVGLRFAELLEADSADTSGGGEWEILMTRETDVFVSLLQRVTLANAFGASSFLSIHANGFGNPSANGTETYAWAEGTTAAALRDRVHARMIAAWGLTDRGTKTANFYVLVNTAMPASLSELAFITNPADALVLADPGKRQEAAFAHLFAVQEHHGFGVHEPGGGVDGTLKGILHDATFGTGAPIAGATVALADGSFTTTSANGLYEFDLPAGTWAFVGTAPGFTVESGSETVTSGDVWESLGLLPANRPTLNTTLLGTTLTLDVTGDALAPVWIAASTLPQIPVTSLGSQGELWPQAASLLALPIGSVSAGGTFNLVTAVPSGVGVPVHLQAYVMHDGAAKLTNGAAFLLP